MRGFSFTSAWLLAAGIALPASAAITVDGVRDVDYGAPLAVQGVGTEFGNNTDASVDFADGSELNVAYGVVQGGNLHLFLAGNLQTNFNKLEIFVDSVSGGQNTLLGNNPDVDFNGLNRMGELIGGDGSFGPDGAGLTFDTGFDADYYLTATGGNDPIEHFASFAELLTAGGGTGSFIGGGPGNLITGSNGILIGFDNSNTLGVGAFGDPNDSDPATVTTGIEVLIPLSVIGNPTGDIRVSAFINGGGHDFLSNQVLGAVDSGNLGEPRSVDFNNITGDQFFTVVIPEPASLALIGLGGLMLMARRRK